MTIGDGIGFAALCLAVTVIATFRRWRELVCDHKWQQVGNGEVAYYDLDSPKDKTMPLYRQSVFRCEKCGARREYRR